MVDRPSYDRRPNTLSRGETLRILLVSLGYRGYASHYAEALRRNGHTVTSYVGMRQGDLLTRAHRVLGVRLPNALGADRHYLHSEQVRLARFIGRLRSPVDFALFVNAQQLATDDLLSELGSRGCPTGLWLLDDADTLETDGLSLGAFDRLATFNPSECESISTMSGRACPYIPQAIAPITGYKGRPATDRPLLVGAPYPRRRAVVEAMAAADIGVDLVGKTWADFRSDLGSAHLFGDVSLTETLAMSSNARICLSAHRRIDTGLSPRIFEIAAAGGLIVTDNRYAADCFEPGTEMLLWHHVGEAVEYAARARAEPAWRVARAAAGTRRALAEHTLQKRFESLFRAWGVS